MIDASESGTSICPFCKSTDACEHLLLVVDKTYREVEGGALSDAFASRWIEISNAHIEDASFNKAAAFEKLLAEVRALADALGKFHHEGAFGISSNYEIYYVETLRRANVVLSAFMANRVQL